MEIFCNNVKVFVTLYQFNGSLLTTNMNFSFKFLNDSVISFNDLWKPQLHNVNVNSISVHILMFFCILPIIPVEWLSKSIYKWGFLKCSWCVLTGPSVSCPPHLFQCGSSECVDPSQLCDGVTNCQDGSDEGGTCQTDKCSEQSKCAQDCHSTPTGTVWFPLLILLKTTSHRNWLIILTCTTVQKFRDKMFIMLLKSSLFCSPRLQLFVKKKSSHYSSLNCHMIHH